MKRAGRARTEARAAEEAGPERAAENHAWAGEGFRLQGRGVHSGKEAELFFRWRSEAGMRSMEEMPGPDPGGLLPTEPSGGENRFPPPSQVTFRLPGRPRPLTALGLAGLPREARRSTVLGTGPSAVGTVEHLLAALLPFRHLPLEVELRGPEIPLLDGSGRPFLTLLQSLLAARGIPDPFLPAGLSDDRVLLPHPLLSSPAPLSSNPAAAATPASPGDLFPTYPTGLRFRSDWPGGYLEVEPAGRFSLDCFWERGAWKGRAHLQGPADGLRALHARTFLFAADLSAHALKAQMPVPSEAAAPSPDRSSALGFSAPVLQGLHPSMGLLLGEGAGELLVGGPFRFPDEPAWHKALDLLGDLAILDLSLPRLRIEVKNGGHAQNHILLQRLIDERRALQRDARFPPSGPRAPGPRAQTQRQSPLRPRL